MQKRIETFNTSTLPIIEHFRKLNLVQEIASDKTPNEVFFIYIKFVNNFF